MSSTTVNLIFNYKLKKYEEIPHIRDRTCEDICIKLSKACGILPPTRHLFGLRNAATHDWLMPCKPLKTNVNYEFRMRFKVSDLSIVKKLDRNAFDYFYHQARHDLVQDQIPEIQYPAFKDNVLGLGIVEMYISMSEKNVSIESIMKDYKQYFPKKLIKEHWFFAKKITKAKLRELDKKKYEIFYAKYNYLLTIYNLAPNYLIEQLEANADFPPEDGNESGTCPVIVQFNPFHEEQPGLRVLYKSKNEWKHLFTSEDIYAVLRESKNTVRFEVSSSINGFRLYFSKPSMLKSFISYVSGYYRLMVKWTMDLCTDYPTPSLQELRELKCHGPIGGEFSYAKIREKKNKIGSYIIRQCEKNYDIYYIDINTKQYAFNAARTAAHTETFQITRKCNQWHLHLQDCVRPFEKLTDLVCSIKTDAEELFRIHPSEYDKPPLLLICLPRNQLTTNKTVSEISEADLQRKRAQIIDPKIDLQWYKNSYKDCENGKMVQMRADWLLPGDKRLKVTLKILKSEKHFTEFMKLANLWSKMYSPEFLKLYGLTLSTPHTMVIEYAPFGALNEFLFQNKEKVPLLCLLEAVHSLVRALVYLKENNIIHGFIRCSSLHVVKYETPATLVAKLVDPGFTRNYKDDDLPWIPSEYYDNMELARKDPKAEFWAFATTVWEIFARGCPIEKYRPEKLRENLCLLGGILPSPAQDCPIEMLETISDGWSSDLENRFSQQLIFSRLIMVKEKSRNEYCNILNPAKQNFSGNTLSTNSKVSGVSAYTDETVVNGSSDSELSITSFNGDLSSMSFNGDRLPLLKNSAPVYPGYFHEIPSILKLPDGKVISKEKIGAGHYGIVFRGEYHRNNEAKPVAIKTLRRHISDGSSLSKDFIREIEIMMTLNHPNIVKILTWTDSPQLSIIMEYIECGSFIIYLSSQKPNLTIDKLLNFAYDIANGMDYLRSKNVIHRDLAARNILVDSECVKISDFGLAQIADSNGYYIVKSNRDIPIKWYAPEAIGQNKFSFQSDVWSYGVTLYEMFSGGEPPDLVPEPSDSHNLLNRLNAGERLRRPTKCPENIYDELMRPCWLQNPKDRPNFRTIMEKIDSLLQEYGECI